MAHTQSSEANAGAIVRPMREAARDAVNLMNVEIQNGRRVEWETMEKAIVREPSCKGSILMAQTNGPAAKP